MNVLQISSLFILFITCFTSYSQYAISSIDEVKLSERIEKIKQSEEAQIFFKSAEEAKIPRSKVDSIVYAKALRDYKIGALKKHSKNINKTFLIDIKDKKFDRNSFVSDFRRTVSSLLTQEQFKLLYKDLLNIQIEREAAITMADFNKKYVINKAKDIKVLKSWVDLYTSKAVLALQYHAYDKKLSELKYGEVLAEASEKYRELFSQLNIKAINPLDASREELFVAKAKAAGINESIANRIIAASLETKKQIKGIDKINKWNSPYIHILETTQHRKRDVRNKFEAQLASLITIEQYKKLFGDQLKEDIELKIEYQMAQITSVYPLTDSQYEEIKILVSDYVNKDLLIYHYYSFDKKLRKEKQKVIKFKFDKSYKKKIKEITI